MHLKLLDKTFKIIDLLNKNHQGLRLSEIVDILELPGSSIHHILSTLRSLDYVDQDQDTKRYFLGFKFLTISSKILEHLDIRRTAYTHLRELHNKLNETINLTVLRNGRVTFIDKIQKIGGLALDTYIGFSTLPHAAASGKVLLSDRGVREIKELYQNQPLKAYGKNTITSMAQLLEELENVRKQGYAIDNEEYYEGVRCVAAPIKSQGRVIAAVSVTGSIFSMSMERINNEILHLVIKTAKKISDEMPA
jgi:IclR family KDG regulon transcriptional repressor